MIVPVSREKYLQFCDAHAQLWIQNGAEIGVAPSMITAWVTLYEDAKKGLDEALIARNAAKTATIISNDRFAASRAATSEIIRKIKDFAISTNNPSVYLLADIPAPVDPSTAPPPGQPTMVRATLNPNGQLTLRWRCDNPSGTSGTFYTVERRLGLSAAAPLVPLGGDGTRRFTDASIPAGSPRVTYIITARRGTRAGVPSDEFAVNFGVSAGGGSFIASTSADASGQVKMAA